MGIRRQQYISYTSYYNVKTKTAKMMKFLAIGLVAAFTVDAKGLGCGLGLGYGGGCGGAVVAAAPAVHHVAAVAAPAAVVAAPAIGYGLGYAGLGLGYGGLVDTLTGC